MKQLLIKRYKEKFNIPTGYSGHESSVLPSIIAATMGASAIERHITLDRAMYGSDQSASIEPNGLNLLVSGVRKIELSIGDGVKRIIEEELPIAKKLSNLQLELLKVFSFDISKAQAIEIRDMLKNYFAKISD